MSNEELSAGPGERALHEKLRLWALGFYALAGMHLVAGLIADLAMSGATIYPFFAIADEPEANSGLFIAAILILFVGYLVSKVGEFIERRRTEKVDQTQEWTVDVGEQ